MRFAADLNHPHILPLCDSGDVHGRLYFVMPLMNGDSLRQRRRRGSKLPTHEALRVAQEIGDGLVAYAHDAGEIHWDGNPENIRLPHGHALPADFGIARSPTKAGESLADGFQQ